MTDDMNSRLLKIMAEHGGPFTSNEDSWPINSKGFEELDSVFQGFLDVSSLHSRKVEFGWVNNGNFNALATVDGNHEVICLYVGLLRIIYNHFLAFFSDPDIIPQIGDVTREIGDKDQIVQLRKSYFSGTAFVRSPCDYIRHQASRHLAYNAVNFIFLHELAHLTNCHVNLMEAELGISNLMEFPLNGTFSNEEAELRVLLELDADHIAARNSWNYFSDLCSRGFFPALSPISPEKCWALSLNMLFRIMHAFQTDTSNPTKRTHPPPMLRNLHIAALSTDPKLPNFIGSEDVFVWGFGIVDGWWKSNNLPIPVGFDGVGSDPVEELNELRRKFHYKYTDQIREFLQVRADANER